MADRPAPRSTLFEPSQRRVIILILLLFAGYLTVRLLRDRQYISDPQPREGARSSEVADRIDLNTADVATLAALPQLGEKRARDIVAYRDRFLTVDPSHPPFNRPEDLLKIRGIGYSMMTQLRPFLVFPSTRPATDRDQ